MSAAEEVHDTSTGTMEDVEAVMKKYDRESNVRVWEGIPGQVIRWLMAVFSLFCLYLTLFDKSLPEKRLTLFLGLIIIIWLSEFPDAQESCEAKQRSWYDVIILVVGGTFQFFYFASNAQDILLKSYNQPQRTVYADDRHHRILALVELCRRSVGVPILWLAFC